MIKPTLSKHALFCEKLRQLNHAMVEANIATQEWDSLYQDLDSITQRVESFKNSSRPAKHFNFDKAKTQPQLVLPYSPISGPLNPIAPPVHLEYIAQTQILESRVTCGRAYEGPPNMIHGAVISGIYDQILALSSVCSDKAGHTAFLHIDFLRPSPLHSELHFRSWVKSIDGRKVTIAGECEYQGEILSRAEGLFIEYVG